MKLTTEKVLAILKVHFPGEQWDDVAEDESFLRLALAERATGGELCIDNSGQFVLYTGVQEA